ncbi:MULTISPECIES: hypothetical protein [Methylomonas]|uniref:Uncharacterized protein n=2 Tax=Methylomonas TaxID=416 RepID=A0A126T7Q5_9GAMM|nr:MULTISPECIES: hypothetical protein [Methylomonas]AMK78117.1 hypothetical protein JT25_016785 [Methylomonas denitrificans]OAH96485.1 hypothetical protein A1342_03060 [Methylomonas methanica]TCV85653.1 hypothetical protein EDE11_105215 [Methylomonas methanica]
MLKKDLGIEKTRLQIEQNRFELEKRRAELENSLLHKHFGAIVAAVVSISAAIVSYAQIQIAQIQKNKELEMLEIKSQRDWKVEAAKFVVENKKVIFSEDDQERQMMRHVISIAFPKEVGDGLLVKVEKIKSGSLIRRYWKPDGKNIDEANANKLKDWLKNNGRSDDSITLFLHAENLDDVRAKAVKELNLENIQKTITNVPSESIEFVKKAAELEGATVTTKRQPDGKWTITSTYSQ